MQRSLAIISFPYEYSFNILNEQRKFDKRGRIEKRSTIRPFHDQLIHSH